MSQLTKKELYILNKEIEGGGLTYKELQQELLDHLCCDVEMKMDEGKEFIKALEEVKKEMGRDCIRQIQEDTLLLINQKYRLMKKFMYILGTVAPILVILGTILKMQHLAGASVLLVLGLSLLALVYLPVFISIRIRDSRSEGKPVNKGMLIIGMISGIIFILGSMFKIMHWPGASIMFTLSGVVAVAIFIPMLVINALKDKENQVQNFTILIFILAFMAITFMVSFLRISVDIMDSFVLAVNDNINTTEVLQENNDMLVEKMVKTNPEMNAKLAEMTGMTNNLNSYINETIEVLVKTAHSKNIEAISKDGNIDFSRVHKKEDTSTPASIMLGIEYEVARGEVIEKMLNELKAHISRFDNKRLNFISEKLLDTSSEKTEFPQSWTSHNFEHLPLMSVIVQLTNIQLNLKLLEEQVLRFYMENAE